jgi:hypothetical protein
MTMASVKLGCTAIVVISRKFMTVRLHTSIVDLPSISCPQHFGVPRIYLGTSILQLSTQ